MEGRQLRLERVLDEPMTGDYWELDNRCDFRCLAGSYWMLMKPNTCTTTASNIRTSSSSLQTNAKDISHKAQKSPVT